MCVLESLEWVALQSQNVKILDCGVAAAATSVAQHFGGQSMNSAGFDKDLHYFDGGPLTAQYLLVVDTLNFCFWPDVELEYEHLARGLKASLVKDPTCLSAAKLSTMTGPDVQQLLQWPRQLPQQVERARLLREVGSTLLQHFEGQAAQLVQAAGGSAVRLVQLITQYLPGFRDHAIYKGQQVFFYKRAQIFVGDLYGAFAGQGLGEFCDIAKLTMFADYRVPVVLRLLGVLEYSPQLAHKVDNGQELPSGSEEEVEIRAASIIAVERLKQAANRLLAAQHQRQKQQLEPTPAASRDDACPKQQQQQQQLTEGLPQLLSIQLDWWLWEEGERMRSEHVHHKTWTIYY